VVTGASGTSSKCWQYGSQGLFTQDEAVCEIAWTLTPLRSALGAGTL